MTRFEAALSDLETADILYITTTSTRQPAKAMCDKDGGAIFMNENVYRTTAERYTVLMHERGHLDSGAMYSVNTPLITVEQCEYRAWKRAVMTVLPFAALLAAFEAGITEVWQLAEYFDVTEDFIRKAVEIYVSLGGV